MNTKADYEAVFNYIVAQAEMRGEARGRARGIEEAAARACAHARGLDLLRSEKAKHQAEALYSFAKRLTDPHWADKGGGE